MAFFIFWHFLSVYMCTVFVYVHTYAYVFVSESIHTCMCRGQTLASGILAVTLHPTGPVSVSHLNPELAGLVPVVS